MPQPKQPSPTSNPTAPTAALFPQAAPLGVYKPSASMTSTQPVAGAGDKAPMEQFAALSDPGRPLGINPAVSFKPSMNAAKSALRETGGAALNMGSGGLASGYEAAETLATELVGEEGFAAQGMHQDQSRRNEELAIVVGAMVKSGHIPPAQAIALMESLPKNGSAEDFSLKSAFALGAQMGASAAPIASFVQSLVTTSAQAAAQRAAGGASGKGRFATPGEKAKASFSEQDIDDFTKHAKDQGARDK